MRTHALIKYVMNMVILQEETFEKFGYYPQDLSHGSDKRILVMCDDCGKIRETQKHHYHALCPSCSIKGAKNHRFGKHHTDEARKKIGEANEGNHHTEETKQKISEANIGKHPTEATRKKISEAQKGEKNGNWKGGISFEPYCQQFNEEFKRYIRNKFGNVCFLCGKTEEKNGKQLCVHHVNYSKECLCDDDETCQFVPLCKSCHSKVHTDRDKWEQYFKNKLRNKLNGWYI